MIHLTEFQTFLLLSILKVLVVLVITLTAVAYTVLLERKVLGRIQNRWGPSRVGPFGLLQPLADGIKLFLKEDLMPIASERPLFIIAPIIALTCALISIAVVPFGGMQTVKVNNVSVQMFNVADLNIGDADGKFYCLDRTTGAVLWTFDDMEQTGQITAAPNFDVIARVSPPTSSSLR